MAFELEYFHERVLAEAEFIASKGATVRETARKFGVSKSTVHKDMAQRLPMLSQPLYAGVRSILDLNKAERHLRGGMATLMKYKKS